MDEIIDALFGKGQTKLADPDNLDALEDVVRQGGYPTPPEPPTNVPDKRVVSAEKLSAAEKAPMPNQTGGGRVRQQMFKLRERMRLMPKMSTFARGVGAVSMAAGTFGIGWEIGSGIRSLYVEPEILPTKNQVAFGETITTCEGGGCGWIENDFPSELDADELVGFVSWQRPEYGYHRTWTQWAGNDPRCQDGTIGGDQPNWPKGSHPVLSKLGQRIDSCRTVNGAGEWFNSEPQPFYQWAYPVGPDIWFPKGFPKVRNPMDADQKNPSLKTPVWPGLIEDTDTDRSQRFANELAENSDDYPDLLNWAEATLGGDKEDPSGQSAYVPKPRVSETYPQYLVRLQAAGLVGRHVVLSEANADSDFGPNVVVRTTPKGGTRQKTGSEVVVFTNPETMSEPATPGDPETGNPTTPGEGNPGEPGGGTGGGDGQCEPWVKPKIDLDPLKLPVGSVFPFGIFTWMGDMLDEWVGNPTAPKLHFPFPATEEGVTIDLAAWDQGMVIIRGTLLAVSTLLLFWWIATSLLQFGGDKGASRDD